jgi:thermitase
VSISRRLTRAPLPVLLALLLVVSLLPAAAGAVPGSSDAAGDRIPERILVKFKDDAPGWAAAQARRLAAAEELSVIDQLGVHVWRVPDHASARALQGLQRNPHVDFAELDAVVELEEVVPNDPDFSRQWGIARTRTDEAWVLSRGSREVVIAILDTGVEPVPDLANKLLPGRNVITGTANTADENGHGTFAASVAAAETDNGIGIASYGWHSMVLPVKVFDGSTGYVSDVVAGITWATDNGADIISMSLSGPSGTTTLQQAVRYARDRDVNLVAAAGNQADSVQRFPAGYAEVIGVAGSQEDDSLYEWSNFGSWVDVAAPGVNRAISRSNNIGSFAGTSSATPAVAGILGLARATGASAEAARSALQEGAKSLPEVKYGRVDAALALELLGTADGAPADPEPEPAPVEPDPEPEPEPVEPDPEPDPEPTPPAEDPEPAPPVIDLTVTTGKARGVAYATLTWTGSEGSTLVYANDTRVGASDGGTFKHETGQRGNPTISYRVCDPDGCSADVVVSNW